MLSDDEQFESKEVLCDYICAAPYGYHKCFSDKDFERFAGCDLAKFTDRYDQIGKKVVEYFPCENCNDKFEGYEKLKEHFRINHDSSEFINCPVNCDYKSKSVNVLIMHIGVNHQDRVRKKLE